MCSASRIIIKGPEWTSHKVLCSHVNVSIEDWSRIGCCRLHTGQRLQTSLVKVECGEQGKQYSMMGDDVRYLWFLMVILIIIFFEATACILKAKYYLKNFIVSIKSISSRSWNGTRSLMENWYIFQDVCIVCHGRSFIMKPFPLD